MNSIIDNKINIDSLVLVEKLRSNDSPFLIVVKNVFDKVNFLLDNRIAKIFPHYTLHNTAHSLRIIDYMGQIIDDVEKLSELEIALLICSALCHDVGMAIDKEDENLIKIDNFPFANFKYSSIRRLINDDTAALQEFVRRIHAELSSRYVRDKLKEVLIIPGFPNIDFSEELALICESHTKDYEWIQRNLKVNQVKGSYSFNCQFIAAILRLGDILDIDSHRAPYRLFENIDPEGISQKEWLQHFIIQNDRKIVFNKKTNQKRIEFHGVSKDAEIHRKVLSYIEWVKDEFEGSLQILDGMPAQYFLNFDPIPKVHIETKGYTFSGYKMTLKFEAISSLLMGEKIYGSKSLGLRELIQNSIDACKLRVEEEQKNDNNYINPYEPKIRIILKPQENKVLILDNGIGMSLDVIKKHFLNIGISYYNSFDFKLKDTLYKPIGNYGIGFLSCFMLSNEVTVITRFFNDQKKYTINLKKGEEWTSLLEDSAVNFHGTEVHLNYNEFLKAFGNEPKEIQKFLSEYFLTDGIDIQFYNNNFTPILNSLLPPNNLAPGNVIIDLNKYLEDVEGYVILKKRREFIRNVFDLDFEGSLYLFEDEKIIPIDEDNTLNIDDFISNNSIKYLSIPLVEDHMVESFNSGLIYTENDIRDVVEKLGNKLNWISILFKKGMHDELDEGTFGRNDSLYIPIEFKQLIELGHSKECDTYISIEEIKLFEGFKNEVYMPFKNDISYSTYRYSRENKDLYIRGVLIKDFMINLPSMATIFEVSKIVINVLSRKLIPDVSRNNFSNNQKEIINYFLGKAIHNAAAEHLNLERKEVTTLQNFTNNFYQEKSEFEKDDYWI